MILRIKQCAYCPEMPGCEYRAQLKAEVRKVLPRITVTHSCPLYRKLFQERDEVWANPFEVANDQFGRNPDWRNTGKKIRGVVIATPHNSRNSRFVVAFFEPFEMQGWGEKPETKHMLGFRANQLQIIGQYTGEAFWESLDFLNALNEQRS